MSVGGRILYVGGFELPDKNAAAHRVLGNAKAFRALGYEVVFLDVDRELRGDELSAPHEVAGFEVYSQRHAGDWCGLLRYSLYPLHVEELLKLYDDWDSVVAYNYPAFALEKLRKICLKKGIKIYSDCTEWYTLDLFCLHHLLIQVDSFFRMRFVQKKLDGVICISSYLENYYKRYTKTVVVPPLIDCDDDKWKRIENEEKHDDGKIRLVYFGSPGYRKDKINEILKAIDRSPVPVEIKIVGLNEEEYAKRYPYDVDIVSNLKEQGRVRFLGRMSHKDALKVVKKADFTIFYRQKNRMTMAGFPTKFVESISCGIPVITTDTSDLSEYCMAQRNGLILKTENFSEELRKLLESSTLKERIKTEEKRFDYQYYKELIHSFIIEARTDKR